MKYRQFSPVVFCDAFLKLLWRMDLLCFYGNAPSDDSLFTPDLYRREATTLKPHYPYAPVLPNGEPMSTN